MPETANVPPAPAAAVTPAATKLAAPVVAPAVAVKPDDDTSAPPVTASQPETLKPQPKIATPEPVAAPTTTAVAPASATPEVTSSAPDSPKYTTAAAGPDAALAEKLRDQLVAGKFDRILGGKKERGAVEQFYASRDFAPLWVTDGTLNERGKAAVDYLAHVDADGLEPSDYPTPAIRPGLDADALADAEIKFTDTILTYARHAMSGRVHYSRVSADIIYDLAKPDPANVLTRIAKATNLAEALDSFEPPQPQYKALKEKLAELRKGGEDVTKPIIPSGPVLKYGKEKKGKEIKEVVMSDRRVPALREWFSLPAQDNTDYDKTLADTIARFQKDHGLSSTGQLTAATLDAMNGPKRERTADIIIANMERWRWMPRDLGKTYVMVNIPDFTLRVVHNDKLVWKTKVVVGQPGKPTPLLSADMKYITVNPTWNVPPSIIQNEYLPALREDPQAMDRIGLKVEQNPDGTVRIWQPPGDRNALGRIRFNFPNKFLVYQHDTPDKYLFARDKRAYSHGCMRVENPLKYGEVLLGLVLPEEHYTAERLQKMFGGSEININFPVGIPDHLTYQTAFVDEAGKLQIRDDVYGRDAKLLAILKNNSERKVADLAVERSRSTSAAPVRLAPGTFGGSSFGSGPSFFQMLFGGGGDSAPRPRRNVGRYPDRRASAH